MLVFKVVSLLAAGIWLSAEASGDVSKECDSCNSVEITALFQMRGSREGQAGNNERSVQSLQAPERRRKCGIGNVVLDTTQVLEAGKALQKKLSKSEAAYIASRINKDPCWRPAWANARVSANNIETYSWDEVATNVRQKSSYWDNLPSGYEGITVDLASYANMAAATFAVVGAIEGLANGDTNWAGAIFSVGNNMLPVLGMVNPLLGVVGATFLSLFGPSSHDAMSEALEKLYSKIMSEVKVMIDEAFVEQSLNVAQNKLAAMSVNWQQSPFILENATDDPFLLQQQVSFLQDQVTDFNNAVADIFGQDCVQNLEPKKPLTKQCELYQTKGSLVFAYQFAMQHMNVYIQYGSLVPYAWQKKDQLANLKQTANMYRALLSASYENWLDYGAGNIPDCKYDVKRKLVNLPKGVMQYDYKMKSSHVYDGNVGTNIPQSRGCEPEYTYQDTSPSVDLCKQTNNWGSFCTDKHYNAYFKSWQNFVLGFGPLIENISSIYA